MGQGAQAFCFAATLLMAAFAGCLQAEVPVPAGGDSGTPVSSRPPVVAILDSGLHPYHVAFAAPGGGAERFADMFGAERFDLAQSGDFSARVEEDRPEWEAIEQGRLYAFAGTRVLGVTFGHNKGELPFLDQRDHGTAVGSLVMREAPEAMLVIVQVDPGICNLEDTSDCPIFPTATEAMRWVADQPWIDVVSLSLGYPGNIPLRMSQQEAEFVTATRLAHDRGKIVIAGSGNTVVPALAGQFAGPPWVIAVGGAQPSQRGDQIQASKGPDVVANFTEWLATRDTLDGWHWDVGTSFAAPIVAGALAEALGRLRAVDPAMPVPPAVLRDALNASSLAWAPTEWDATRKPTNDTLANYVSNSVPALTPAQSGWGYVDGSIVDELVRRVLEDDLEPPAGKALTARYMAEWQGLRERYWQSAP